MAWTGTLGMPPLLPHACSKYSHLAAGVITTINKIVSAQKGPYTGRKIIMCLRHVPHLANI